MELNLEDRYSIVFKSLKIVRNKSMAFVRTRNYNYVIYCKNSARTGRANLKRIEGTIFCESFWRPDAGLSFMKVG